ncbi:MULTISPECIES: hypothetical protein [Mammaliicoccus]|uniref:hypothetical protein n=1 Tax=Mammaliicoccus TaxID=2803850 RepID=UPI00177ED061|nr:MULTISPECIES: hypothetical protein [Mammaliicoccus]
MPTIKTKKEMNLPELIEWLWDNQKLRQCTVISNMYNIVEQKSRGRIEFSGGAFHPEELFTVISEEIITEYTNLDTLVEVRENGTVHTHYDTSIREEERDSTVEFHTLIEGKLVLIWDREEGLVE